MTDPMLDRQVRRRLAILRHADEMTGTVAMTCRYFRHQPAGVLHVATPLRRAWRARAAGPISAAAWHLDLLLLGVGRTDRRGPRAGRAMA